MDNKIIITCEHASNDIPEKYRHSFTKYQNMLTTHRGIDIGALQMAKCFANTYANYSRFASCSRLLVDMNRSVGNPNLFSEITQVFSEEEKKEILTQFYFPYRQAIQNVIDDYIKNNAQVLHLSIHSFTPELHGKIRKADIGLLYDPRRASELKFCKAWQQQLKFIFPYLIIRRNYPYLGIGDGLTTSLRKIFPSHSYIGVELEVNQKFFVEKNVEWLLDGLVKSLQWHGK